MKTIKLFITFLTLLSATGAMAQEYFEYADGEAKTIISGLTYAGMAVTELTIPAQVTEVQSRAFANANEYLANLTIEGNPAFESGLFGERSNPLDQIDMGSSMSVANMYALLTSLGSRGNLTKVIIDGYSGSTISWDDVTINGVLTSDVRVVLPAALVNTQQFGYAHVYGRFTISKEIISFCCEANFQDDGNTNMLFYIADKCDKDKGNVHIQRVDYLAKDEGLLIHRTESSTGACELLRIDEVPDMSIYAGNKLVGVTAAKTIDATEGDMTNLVLKDGVFYRTNGGTIGAHKAYLQVPTSMAARESWTIDFSEDETTGVKEVKEVNDNSWYDLQGRKVTQPTKGLYINKGRKIIMK